MRAYSVTHGDNKVHFLGSEVEARQFRMELMKSEGLKRKEIDVKLVEIPTTKAELLNWLNSELKR